MHKCILKKEYAKDPLWYTGEKEHVYQLSQGNT